MPSLIECIYSADPQLQFISLAHFTANINFISDSQKDGIFDKSVSISKYF